MSTAATTAESHGQHDDGHNPHLAHHFDTPEQQIASGKLGMWVFLATEILMFGGLFCAYSVYRHNHPEVFAIAHTALNPLLGGINTLVLITSSLTMAWAVRAAQLGKSHLLAFLLILTLIGGFGFMAIKAIEYRDKWEHHLGLGISNKFNPQYKGPKDAHAPAASHASAAKGDHAGHAAAPLASPSTLPTIASSLRDPNAGTPDAAAFVPTANTPHGLAPKIVEEHRKHLHAHELDAGVDKLPTQLDKDRVNTFFQIYFAMTGLHGIHVVVGMLLIFWILLRSVSPASRRYLRAAAIIATGGFLAYLGLLVHSDSTLSVAYWVAGFGLILFVLAGLRKKPASGQGEFGPQYFAPVDLVGLYWHLVDLIWIFLFPLLYLIH